MPAARPPSADNPVPPNSAQRKPLLYQAPGGTGWFRSHDCGREAIHYGRHGSQRFDSPTGNYGVLYLADDPEGAFMESIGRGVLRTAFVPAATLRSRCLSKLVTVSSLRLMDLAASGGLTRIGAEGGVTAAPDYSQSQQWSAAIRAHPSRPDGIRYRPRHDPERIACALFDRAASHVRLDRNRGAWADQGTVLGQILDRYGLGTDL